ncbi:MAG: extracellular solute-binding protein, partial [Clostridia bacterium]|nr:extracellular solute-binding protein [Clostridia bacterium]
MKKLTRVMAIVLALLCALALVSCGGDSETTADVTTTVATTQKQDETVVTTTGNTTGTVSSVTNTTVSNKDTKEPTNKPGVAKIDDLITRTKNASGNATDAFVNSLKGYNLTIMYPWEQKKPGSTIGDSLEYCREEVEKEFGVTLTEDGYFSGYNEALTASLTARNAKAQVYMLQNFNFVSYFSNGYITDLTAAMKTAGVDFNEPWYIQDAQAFLNIDYRQYGWIAFSGTYTFPYCIIYNQEYIKNARLTDPAELAEQGKWTWDTL